MSKYFVQAACLAAFLSASSLALGQTPPSGGQVPAAAPAPAEVEKNLAQPLAEVEQWIRSGGTEQQASFSAGNLDAARRWLVPDPDPAAVLALTSETLVDWSTLTVRALASTALPATSLNPVRSRALAQRQAAVQARRLLLDVILTLPLAGGLRVDQGLTSSERAVQLRGMVQNSQLEVRTVASKGEIPGVCTVVATLNLLGPVGECVIPLAEPFLSSIPPQVTLAPELALPAPETSQEGDPSYRNSMAELGGYTGLLVDARGLDLHPALLQRVVDSAGLGAYGSFCVSRSAVIRQGMALFIADRADLRVAERLGASPLYVRALAVSQGSDLVVSQADGDLLRQSFAAQGDRSRSPLVVLLDRTDLSAASPRASGAPAAAVPSAVSPEVQ